MREETGSIIIIIENSLNDDTYHTMQVRAKPHFFYSSNTQSMHYTAVPKLLSTKTKFYQDLRKITKCVCPTDDFL